MRTLLLLSALSLARREWTAMRGGSVLDGGEERVQAAAAPVVQGGEGLVFTEPPEVSAAAAAAAPVYELAAVISKTDDELQLSLPPNALKVADAPEMWLLEDWASEAAILDIEAAAHAERRCWGRDDALSSTCDLEVHRSVGEHPVLRALDARLAELAGVGVEQVEYGYFQKYKSGFKVPNLHLDQNTRSMSPRRVLSFLLYFGNLPHTGATVFPLAELTTDRGLRHPLDGRSRGLRDERPEWIHMWDTQLLPRSENRGDFYRPNKRNPSNSILEQVLSPVPP